MTTPKEVGRRFVNALERRDYDALGPCFAEDGQLRAIVPPGLREDDGREAIVAPFRRWTNDGDYSLLSAGTDAVIDGLRARFAISVVDPDAGPSVFEQTAYADIEDGAVTRLRLACSGSRPA